MNRYFLCLCLILSVLLMRGDPAIPSPSSWEAAAFANAIEAPLPHAAGTYAYASASVYFRGAGGVGGRYACFAKIEWLTGFSEKREVNDFMGALGKTEFVELDVLAGPDAITTSAYALVSAGGKGDASTAYK